MTFKSANFLLFNPNSVGTRSVARFPSCKSSRRILHTAHFLYNWQLASITTEPRRNCPPYGLISRKESRRTKRTQNSFHPNPLRIDLLTMDSLTTNHLERSNCAICGFIGVDVRLQGCGCLVHAVSFFVEAIVFGSEPDDTLVSTR